MKPDGFRKLALAMPEAEESEHHNHPDFRVAGKIFATIGPEGDWAMVKLPPETQAELCHEEPGVFEPVNGAWGKQGCTRVILRAATVRVVRPAVKAAWLHNAPDDLLDE